MQTDLKDRMKGDRNEARIGPAMTEADVKVDVHPSVLYFGTPVVLVSSMDMEGNVNLSPMSSAWALGYNVVLGLSTAGKTWENLEATGELTLNFPDRELWRSVEALAPLTGRNPVPHAKTGRYRFESDKYGAAHLTQVKADEVRPPLVLECPLQMEARVEKVYPMSGEDLPAVIVEVSVVKVHARSDLVLDEHHMNPSRWNPLIYSFRHYFSLGEELGRTFKSEV